MVSILIDFLVKNVDEGGNSWGFKERILTLDIRSVCAASPGGSLVLEENSWYVQKLGFL